MTHPKMWGGRVSEAINPDFKKLNDSLSVDRELLVGIGVEAPGCGPVRGDEAGPRQP